MKPQESLKDVTILVSYFNKEEFIDRLFKSLKALAHLGARIVIINDGSTVHSTESLISAISELSTEIGSITLHHQRNVGSAATRNRLVEKVKTPFFVFLDADDEIDADILSKCLHHLEDSNADLLVAGIESQGEFSPYVMPERVDVIKEVELDGETSIYQKMGYWRYLYRTKFIRNNNIRFIPEKNQLGGKHFIFDDVFWMIQLEEIARKIIVTPFNVAFYRYFPPSFTQQSRFEYREQEKLMPAATQIYLKERCVQEKSLKPLSQKEIKNLCFNLDSCYHDLSPKSKISNFPSYIFTVIKIAQKSQMYSWRLFCIEVPKKTGLFIRLCGLVALKFILHELRGLLQRLER